jgi:catechol 2,3-dioxygenase-like lactoylglutathione lyase family enzyme
MILKHVALACSSEKSSDRLCQHLLGLEKEEPKTLDISLAKAIFNVDTDLLLINYRDENLHFEIFITGQPVKRDDPIGHVCLEVKDLKAFLHKSRQLQMEIIQVPRGNRTLTFLRDDDGHLFEIKEWISN